METAPKTVSLKPENTCSISIRKDGNAILVQLDGNQCPEAEFQLKAKGFRFNKGQNGWTATVTPERELFITALEAALAKGGALPEIQIEYPYDPTEDNIRKKRYSLVKITVNGTNDPPITEHYLVFDPSKPVAEGIAELYARQEFGVPPVEVSAHPRRFIPEARKLLNEGKVIPDVLKLPGAETSAPQKDQSTEKEALSTSKDEREKSPTPPVPPITEKEVNETPKVEADQREEVRESQATGKPEEDYQQLLRSIRKEKASLKDMLDQEQSSRIFRKITDLIPNLLRLIGKGHHFGSSQPDGESELFFEYIGEQGKRKHIILLSHYLPSSEGWLPNPTIEIRMHPGSNSAEVLSLQHPGGYRLVYINDYGRELVNPKERKYLNEFLDEWLTQLLQAGHQIDLSKKQSAPDQDWRLTKVKEKTRGWQKSPLERMKNIRSQLDELMASDQAAIRKSSKEMQKVMNRVKAMEKVLLNPEKFPADENE